MYTNKQVQEYRNEFNLLLFNIVIADKFESNLILDDEIFLALMVYSDSFKAINLALLEKNKLFVSYTNNSFKLRRVFDIKLKDKGSIFTLNKEQEFIVLKDIKVLEPKIN